MTGIVDLLKYAENGKELNVDDRLRKNPLVIGMKELVLKHDMYPIDMKGLRQWGKASDGRVVLLDTGATHEVMDEFYETE